MQGGIQVTLAKAIETHPFDGSFLVIGWTLRFDGLLGRLCEDPARRFTECPSGPLPLVDYCSWINSNSIEKLSSNRLLDGHNALDHEDVLGPIIPGCPRVPLWIREHDLDKIKQLEKEERRKNRLEEIEKEVRQEEAKEKQKRQEKAKQALIKGNVASPGNALHGLQKLEFDEYKGSIQAHVYEHWALPEWLKTRNLKASVVVYIDETGNITKRDFIKTSGDEAFDDYVLKAVDESSPFPRPPDRLKDVLKYQGLVLGFPL